MWRLKSTKENMGSVCVDIFLNPRCPTAKCYSKSCGNWHSKLQRMSNLKIATTVQQIFRSLQNVLKMARLLMWNEPKGNRKFAVLKSSLSIVSLLLSYHYITKTTKRRTASPLQNEAKFAVIKLNIMNLGDCKRIIINK